MKTVKIKDTTFGSQKTRRAELFNTTPDGKLGYSVLCAESEVPCARSGVANRWVAGPVCEPTDRPVRWWTAEVK